MNLLTLAKDMVRGNHTLRIFGRHIKSVFNSHCSDIT